MDRITLRHMVYVGKSIYREAHLSLPLPLWLGTFQQEPLRILVPIIIEGLQFSVMIGHPELRLH